MPPALDSVCDALASASGKHKAHVGHARLAQGVRYSQRVCKGGGCREFASPLPPPTTHTQTHMKKKAREPLLHDVHCWPPNIPPNTANSLERVRTHLPWGWVVLGGLRDGLGGKHRNGHTYHTFGGKSHTHAHAHAHTTHTLREAHQSQKRKTVPNSPLPGPLPSTPTRSTARRQSRSSPYTSARSHRGDMQCCCCRDSYCR